MSDEQNLIPTDPSPGAPPPPPPPSGTTPEALRFDLGHLFAFAFRDPRAVSRFVLGSIAVLLIPLFGLGLFALLGFLVHTARNEFRGDEHPLADWDDLGALLVDGLKAAGILFVYAAIGFLVSVVPLVLGFVVMAIAGEANGAAMLLVLPAGVLLVALIVFVALVTKLSMAGGIQRFVVTGRFGSAFEFPEIAASVRGRPGPFIYMLLAALLFSFLADLGVLLCLIGLLPGYFWSFAATGAALGRAARMMDIRPERAP